MAINRRELGCGSVPLDVLDGVIDRHIKESAA